MVDHQKQWLKYESPSEREQKWIIDNCRTTPDIPLGPRKDLYEEWIGPLEVLPVPGEESLKDLRQN